MKKLIRHIIDDLESSSDDSDNSDKAQIKVKRLILFKMLSLRK